jgi:hypothetical protein
MMAHSKSATLLLCLALTGATVAVLEAQTVDSLIARHLEARGGVQRLEAIETLSMSGRAIAGPGREAMITREVRPPDRIRTEFTHQGVTSVYACDGERCWFVAPMSGTFDAELMSPSDTSLAMVQADVLVLTHWKAKGHRIELVGTEAIDGRAAYKLMVSLSGGAVQMTYLDVESALVVRKETTRTSGGRTIEVQTTFGDFRPVEGVVFAHSITSKARGEVAAGSESLEVIVEEIKINAPLDDGRFEMPEIEPAG